MYNLSNLVCDYILAHDLRESSADQIHRITGVFRSFCGEDIPVTSFTGELISRFLLAKQEAGRSSHYRKSLRNCLIALLRFSGKTDRVRVVKLDELEPTSWTPEEVERLIESAGRMYRTSRRLHWQRLIAVAYYSGLTQCDLCRIRRQDIDARGILRFRRSKTGKRVVAAIPLDLLDGLPTEPGAILFPAQSKEAFRATFARIVKGARLVGSFKKLRKTTGTEVEKLHPGRGHEALANTRKVFEAHYWDRRDAAANPIGPAALPQIPVAPASAAR